MYIYIYRDIIIHTEYVLYVVYYNTYSDMCIYTLIELYIYIYIYIYTHI